ncbi:heterokaryon incompatibility protein-domain-containing protein [Xylariales sp. PMI_506]|nr:heterokaryon incompatibility protein-domain-containing protein [Xylariales sp. PMI_506]
MNRLIRMISGGEPGETVQSCKRQFSEIAIGPDRVPKCMGCRSIEFLLKRGPSPVPICIHNDYAELTRCAERCITCRVIRRAVIMSQPTVEGSRLLEMLPYAVRACVSTGETLKITLDVANTKRQPIIKAANILLGAPTTQEVTMLEYLFSEAAPSPTYSPAMAQEMRIPEYANIKSVTGQVGKWAKACRGHSKCGNLTWSTTNPTRLIKICSGQKVQLVENMGQDLVEYTALSYCWGTPGEVDTDSFERGKTTRSNVSQRKRAFSTDELPATILDAVRLTSSIGLSYIWVDMICIVQDDYDDWTTQAAQMGEVYANSYFTICAFSVDRATAGLFKLREAWSYPIEISKLNQRPLTVEDPSLEDLKARSPWAGRAWTLQEEILSPRRLYWGPQKMYWTCCEVQEVESGSFTDASSTKQPSSAAGHAKDLTQAFLTASRTGTLLHERWQELVELYTRRRLTKDEDRYNAIAGLAARYKLRNPTNVYMAGLWQDTFAQDLAWRVHRAGVHAKHRSPCRPSWSWSSLPTGIAARMRRESASPRIMIEEIVDEVAPHENLSSTPDITSVIVTGHIRPFISSSSMPCLWTDITRGSAHNEQFSFAKFVDKDIYSVDYENGLLLAYEAHHEETLCQLDYMPKAESIDVVTIECLELDESTMVLLRVCSSGGETRVPLYERIGVSWRFRGDFFKDTKVETIQLV